MTLNGTVNRTGILLICAFATAAYTWRTFMQTHDPSDVSGLLMVGVFGGFITAMVTDLQAELGAHYGSDLCAPGRPFPGRAFQPSLEMRYPGIAIQAVGLTLACC